MSAELRHDEPGDPPGDRRARARAQSPQARSGDDRAVDIVGKFEANDPCARGRVRAGLCLQARAVETGHRPTR
jgi:hypothetical protein